MKRLLQSKSEELEKSESINPLDSVANLADVMLVLVVGFMLALIINWNLDVGAIAQLQQDDQIPENSLEFDGEYLEEIDTDSDDIDSKEMEKLGSVYYDEETGMYYIIVE